MEIPEHFESAKEFEQWVWTCAVANREKAVEKVFDYETHKKLRDEIICMRVHLQELRNKE